MSDVVSINDQYDARQASVAYDPSRSEFLVAYQADNTAVGEEEVFAQRLTSLAVPVGAVIPVSDVGTDGDTDFDAFEPDVVYNAAVKRYAVVFRADTATDDEFEVFVQEYFRELEEIGGGNEFTSALGDLH